MKLKLSFVFFLVSVFDAVNQLQAAKILAVVPTPSYSHQIPYRRLWRELHDRGHEITLITSNPMANMNATTFRQIDISGAYKDIRAIDFIKLRFDKVDWLQFTMDTLIPISENFAVHTLGHPEVQELIAPNSTATFDVVILEVLAVVATYGLAHRFNAPMIGLSSLGLFAINEHAMGGFVLPSHEYTWEMESKVGTHKPFWSRLYNYVTLHRTLYHLYRDLIPAHQKIADQYFGTPMPPLLELLKNTSVMFINQADVLTPARPKLANMITFTSFHVEEKLPPVPKDLQDFMDSATEGFIYLSLGSNAMSSDLPAETRQIMLDVFAKLPYKVVWKYEKNLPKNTDKIFYGKWLPQQSILAHPNIKLFIYQGGLQSSEEAVQATVPLLGFPVLADQDYQVLRMVSLGVAKMLEISDFTREEFESAIRTLITDKSYKERMIALKDKVNDNPYDMAKYLAWWVEYVIRHKGAPHLRSTLADQPWYQRGDMDIIIFLTIVMFIVISNLTSLIAKLVVRTYKHSAVQSYNTKRKIR